jgi:fibronectin-binding autotransporter adhesin
MLKNKTSTSIVVYFLIYWLTFGQLFAANLDLPTNGVVAAGAAEINSTATKMTINQSTDQVIINWNTFNIGKDAHVQFIQPSVDSSALNRVLSVGASNIFGQLTSNGNVFLINPNGILFGPSSSVDVGSLIATTANISDSNFLNKNYTFTAEKLSELVNQGQIKGGSIALIGPSIRNEGYLIASLGDVVLASSDKVSLSFGPNQRISVAVDPSKFGSQIQHTGSISATKGSVIIRADAAQTLVDQTINGPSSANAIVSNNGVVRLVSISGSIKANSVSLDSGILGQSYVNGSIDVSQNNGKGGDINILGQEVYVDNLSKLNATGALGGGNILVGGDWQGGNGVAQSIYTSVESGAILDVSAIDNGNGGKIVAWSDITDPNSKTITRGTFLARGGANSGNGGNIETSGSSIDFEGIQVDTKAPKGNLGLWLIDPYNYTIGSSQATSIGSALASSNVEITTSSDVTAYGSSGSNSDTGNITINSNITGSLGSLTLTAAGTIYLNANISTAGSQTFNSNVIVSAASAQLNSTNNSSAGGDIIFAGTINGSSANANSLFILSGAGAISVAGNIGSTTALSYLGLGGTGTYVPGSTQNFTSTGAQTFTASVSGAYTFQTWGAKGGNGWMSTGGNGGYATGVYTLSAGDIIYVYVGAAGTIATSGSALGGGWNGGGNGGIDTAGQNSGGGGGATDIRVGGTALANRVIVAGGGGGGGRDGSSTAGVGGGTSGTSGTNYNTTAFGGGGGTQSLGGAAYSTSRGGTSGSLGQGGNGSTGYYAAGGGGGGGGYYGGGGGVSTVDHGQGWASAGGGGSGYIGGVTSGSTIAGNASMTNPAGGTMTGNSGNGYARISIEESTSFTAGTQTGTITLSGAVVSATTRVNTIATASIAGVISGTGALIKDGSGSLTLSNANTYSGNTTINAGTLAVTGSLGTSRSYAGNISNSGVLTYNSSLNQTLGGIVSGTGSLSKLGTGTLTLSGANSYSGDTLINAGTLTVSGSLANTSAVNILSGATYNLGASDTVGSITGAGNIMLNSYTLTSGGDNTSTNFSGVISGAGALTKSGNGTLTLSGANEYTGGTTVASGGTLKLANASALSSSSSVTVSSGGTLDVNGYSLSNTLNLSGTGVSSVGALYNSSTSGITIGGIITLGATASITSLGDVIFNNAIRGVNGQNYSLTMTATGKTITLNGLIGADPTTYRAGSSGANPYALNISAGLIKINNDITTNQNQTYTGAVEIGDNGSNGTTRTLLSLNPNVTFNNTVDDLVKNTHTLDVRAIAVAGSAAETPQVNFLGDVGGTKALYAINAIAMYDPSPSVAYGNIPGTYNTSENYTGNIRIGGKFNTELDQNFVGKNFDFGTNQPFSNNGNVNFYVYQSNGVGPTVNITKINLGNRSKGVFGLDSSYANYINTNVGSSTTSTQIPLKVLAKNDSRKDDTIKGLKVGLVHQAGEEGQVYVGNIRMKADTNKNNSNEAKDCSKTQKSEKIMTASLECN